MAYSKQAWRDYDDTKTENQNRDRGAVVTPERLNHMETGIANSAERAELEQTKQDIASQLAQTDKYSKERTNDLSKGVPTIKKKRPIISFVDDDGHSDVWTRLRPIFDRQNVPASIAVVTKELGKSGLTAEQIQSLYHDYGWEILSHTHDHFGFNSLNAEEIEEQCRLSKEAIENLGVPCNSIVYPGGQKGAVDTRWAVSKHFRSGLTTNNHMATNKIPFDTYSLTRVGMGTMTDTPSTAFPNTNTLEYYKACVDKAVSEGSWLVFMLHINPTPEEQLPLIEETIEYIKSLNVEILTVNDALNEMGNVLEVGNSEDPNADYLVIDALGKAHSNELGAVKIAPRNTLKINTPIEEVDDNKITYGTVDYENREGTPSGTGGTIKFQKIDNYGFYRKFFEATNNNEIYINTIKTDGSEVGWNRQMIGGKQLRTYIAFGTNLAPHTTRDRTADVEDVVFGDIVIVTPRVALPPNIMYSAFVSEKGKVTIRLSNPTTENITDILNYEWMITYVR